MMWFFAALVVLALGGVALLASGRGRPMAEAYDDRPDAVVPREGSLGPDDLRQVRFSLAFRGYRMTEVDTLLDRLADQLSDRLSDQPSSRPCEESVDRPFEEPLAADPGASDPDTGPPSPRGDGKHAER
ncbi:MAG: DivIVA domain-containing protein [Nocardioides sp.]